MWGRVSLFVGVCVYVCFLFFGPVLWEYFCFKFFIRLSSLRTAAQHCGGLLFVCLSPFMFEKLRSRLSFKAWRNNGARFRVFTFRMFPGAFEIEIEVGRLADRIRKAKRKQ